MRLSIVVAMDDNHLIGKGNGLPWHLPADLAFFKKINEKFKPSHTKVSEAIETYQKTQNDKNLFNLFLL